MNKLTKSAVILAALYMCPLCGAADVQPIFSFSPGVSLHVRSYERFCVGVPTVQIRQVIDCGIMNNAFLTYSYRKKSRGVISGDREFHGMGQLRAIHLPPKC
jgi:hypothetical protein